MPGKTTKPLWIIADDSLCASAEYAELTVKGHRVQRLSTALETDLQRCDAIHSEKAWRMLPELTKYLPAAVKAARERVYGAHNQGD